MELRYGPILNYTEITPFGNENIQIIRYENGELSKGTVATSELMNNVNGLINAFRYSD